MNALAECKRRYGIDAAVRTAMMFVNASRNAGATTVTDGNDTLLCERDAIPEGWREITEADVRRMVAAA